MVEEEVDRGQEERRWVKEGLKWPRKGAGLIVSTDKEHCFWRVTPSDVHTRRHTHTHTHAPTKFLASLPLPFLFSAGRVDFDQ